jgi:hypothetical protein
VVGRVDKLGAATALLEELVSEFEGLESQLPNQFIASRAGGISHSRRCRTSRRDSLTAACMGGASEVASGVEARSASAVVEFRSKQEIPS